ncbi:hypothetical protein T07_11591 [Trichinella nelsoni]|uniref:Uncharacterized protein n=1 Tax=Trichinella nelsoni TaxID=6336 RepID=A0A0V0SEQ4_9BILA|nr:hypothetical protein T07_11591 [Trichinella nelsoni]
MKVHIFTAHLFLTRLRYQRPAALETRSSLAQLPLRRPSLPCPLTGAPTAESHCTSSRAGWIDFQEMTLSIS